ncbi:MAG: ATP-binding cassette domain-containing protein [Bryobacteraceae bacterium]|nr:ATP-binding cassette domain-containing protein [Bryobacteraceae bacterium]MDW8379121.1 ATP-binding cassette domain-containing protein [Bryobacterales bacterium]
MAEAIVRFESVTVAFDGVPAIEDVSFEIFPGESRVILGAAGSGKTVILKTTLGLLRPERGRVFLFGHDITRMKEHELFDLRARCGMLFQEGALFDSLTIEENVAYPLLNQKSVSCPPEEVRARVEEALRFVELAHTLDKYPSELSGGMRRRVGIARANVTEPSLVLYDSPTAGLDPITANNIMALIVKERDVRRATTVIVTQRFQDGLIMDKYRYNPQTQSLEPAQRDGEGLKFLVLKQGRLVFEGSQQELQRSTDPYISKFVMRH